MPHLGPNVPQTMVTLLTKAVGAFVLMVLFFIFRYIFELEFTCSCTPGGIHLLGIMYVTLPPCIIYLMLYALSNKYQRQCCNTFLSFIVQQFLQLLSIGFIWIAAVLINGDWYVCLKGNSDEIHMKIPCKKKDNLTFNETMFIVKHKNDSIMYGLWMTFATVFWVVWSCLLIKCRCHEPYYKRFYKDQLSQEVEKNLRAELTELAQDRSKAIIKEPIKVIRESENNTRNDNTNSDVKQKWDLISNLFFYESERQESYEMSLFDKHLQAQKKTAINQSLQELAAEEAEITNQSRFAKFISNLNRNRQEQRTERSGQARGTHQPECEGGSAEDDN